MSSRYKHVYETLGRDGRVKSLIVTLLIVVGGGLLILMVVFGTITPCGILRAELRKEATREGGFGLILSALPDGAIDALLTTQFGPLSPGRCLQLALSGTPPVPNQSAPRVHPLQAVQRQAQIEAAQVANLRKLTERLSGFTAKAGEMLSKFAPVEERYRFITQRMRAGLNREQSIYGNGQASVARGQISVAINQASIEANQLHISVESSYRDFDYNSGQLGHASMEASQNCQGARVVTATYSAPAGHEERNSACLQFFDAAREFQQRVADLRGAFNQIERVWAAERREQEEIVQTSNVAVR
jgi:hypothetical protein